MALTAIYLDLDGVLVDFMGGVARLAGVDVEPFYSSRNTHWWGVMDILKEQTGRDWSKEDFWGLIEDAGHDFWAGLEKYPWADELYDLCREMAPTVIMTSPGLHPSSASGKMEWIRDNLTDVRRFAITPCKHHMSHPGALLIDDAPPNFKLFTEHGGVCYLFPQPWNDVEGWRDRDRLGEIRSLIEQMKAEP